MADDIKVPDAGGSNPSVATDDVAGRHYQIIKPAFGADGAATLVDGSNGMPVSVIGTAAVSGPLTDAQLRAANVPVSGTVTATGPLTDTQLRASVVPVSPNITRGAGVVDANTQRVTLSSDGPLVTSVGNQADTPATTDSGTFSLIALFKRLLGKSADLVATIPFNNVSAPPVRPVGEDIWNVSFSDVGASVLSSELKPSGYPIVGTGVTYSQATGNLAIVAGTTANAEFLARSVTSWQGALRLKFALVASQRIANNNLAVMLADLIGEGLSYAIVSSVLVDVAKTAHNYTAQNVGQFMNLGGVTGAAGVPGRYAIASIPDANTIRFTVASWPGSGSGTLTLFGHSYVRNLFTSTTATAVDFDGQRRGWATGNTTATINTTASPGVVVHNELTGRELFLFDQLRASTTTPTVATRASRVENIPDDNLTLYAFVWSFNGTTNPATSTTWTISFMAVEKFANTPVYIQGSRANGAVNPRPVSFAAAQSVTQSGTWTAQPGNTANTTAWLVSTRPTASVTGANTKHRLVTAATTNATSVKASAGMLYAMELVNNDASFPIFVKLYNKASAPTVGTDTPTETIRVNSGATVQLSWQNGNPFSTGLAYAVTGGQLDSDTTGVAATSFVHLKYS